VSTARLVRSTQQQQARNDRNQEAWILVALPAH
jgi:hypothetical protein